MTVDDKPPEGLSLRRWSQRKFAAAREKDLPAAPTNPLVAPAAGPSSADGAQPPAAPASSAALPPVASLTMDSDFAPFFQPKVGETLKRQALKQLFRDPHFNAMDGLDVYVGDYSMPDPISSDIVRQMVQGRYIFDPPATRINAQGHAEDVPPEDRAPGGPGDPVAIAAATPSLPGMPEAATTIEPPPAASTEGAVDPAAPSDPGVPGSPTR